MSEFDSALQSQIEKIIEDGLENYSGVDYGAASCASYDILCYGNKISPDLIQGVVKEIGSYDPWEGFELNSINIVVSDIWSLLNKKS